MGSVIDLTSKVFGRLQVIGRSEGYKTGNGTDSGWIVQCTCGSSQFRIRGSSLRRGKAKSCGCLQGEIVAALKRTHGHQNGGKKTPEYTAWDSMIQRCTNPHCKAYARDGGRDIRVCDRWLKFDNFVVDRPKRPKGTSLERIDNEGDYTPSNCKWATKLEQQNNMSTNRILNYQGAARTLAEWARIKQMKYVTLAGRLNAGWPVERALTTPVGG